MSDLERFPHGPHPIPTLTGKDAEKFIKNANKPLTKKQKKMLAEAEEVYKKIKQRTTVSQEKIEGQ